MKKLFFIMAMALLSLASARATVYVRMDYDYKGAITAEAAFKALAEAEHLNVQSLDEILDNYTSAEVATAGIWLAKFLERNALKDVGIFSSAENYYYKQILYIVERRIMPRSYAIGKLLLKKPEKFMYWGPYMYKILDNVMKLCMQFELVVTNGKCSFSGVQFLTLTGGLSGYFDVSKLGDVQWDELWNNLIDIPVPKWEDFREDFKALFSRVSPVNIAVAGGESIKGHASEIFKRFEEAPKNISELFSGVSEAFQEVASGAAIKGIMEDVIGDLKDSLAVERLFDINNYNIGEYVSNYVNQLKGQYYTQRWYIYHLGDGGSSSGGGSGSSGGSSYYTQMYSIVLTLRDPSCGSTTPQVVYSENYDSRYNNVGDFEIQFNNKYNSYVSQYRGLYGDCASFTVEMGEMINYGGGYSSGGGGGSSQPEQYFKQQFTVYVVHNKDTAGEEGFEEEFTYDSQFDVDYDWAPWGFLELGYQHGIARYGDPDRNNYDVSLMRGDKVYYSASSSSGGGGKVIDYEEVFDSHVHSEVVFEKKFEAMRADFEKNSDPHVDYYIGKDEQFPYDLTNDKMVKNKASATFTVNCHDEIELSQGGFNFKVNERFQESKMKEYAYPPDMVITPKEPEDTKAWEDEIARLEEQVAGLRDTAQALYNEYLEKLHLWQNTYYTEPEMRDERSKAASDAYDRYLDVYWKIDPIDRKIREIEGYMDEYEYDYNEDLDGPYRIPTLENDLAGDFHIKWDGPGTWSGLTYSRNGHITGMENGVRFIAEVRKERGESRFLGIRYHRAIVGVEYKLISEYDYSDIVDVMNFDDDSSDEENAGAVNERRYQIQQEYPSCHVEVKFQEKDPPDEDEGEVFHLLWMSDRVALARFIVHRLREIDAQLALLHSNLLAQTSVLEDFKKAFLHEVPRWRRNSPYGLAFGRWMNAGTGHFVITH